MVVSESLNTLRETSRIQFFYGGGNVYGCERSAIFETVDSQTCHGRGDVYVGERRTANEAAVHLCY